jgi:putative pyruvate formate lyase activating enzyme
MTSPSYLALFEQGVLRQRAETAREQLRHCALCPRQCGTNRLEGAGRFCRAGSEAVVSAFHPHFGEEAPLVGRHGSGTIFFASCSLGCVFCQNWTTSRMTDGCEVSARDLARMMVELQRERCHNINLVTPTHMVAQILSALELAVPMGLRLPIVYNTSGYERVETVRLLEDVVDIYMPDIKFMSEKAGEMYAGAPDYPRVVRAAVLEMHRQAGDLMIDETGLAVRGVLVRHLVMPNGAANTPEVCRFLAREVSPSTCVNLMDQYRPCGEANLYPEIARRVTPVEMKAALQAARDEGLRLL